MDIRFCYYITAIAEEQNLTRAAEKLFITQSALSQQLDKMEHELNTTLFVHVKNKMILTESGELFFHGAKRIIQIKETAYQKISNMSKHYTDQFSIAINRQTGSLLMSKFLPVFKQTYPDVKVHLQELDTFVARQAVLNGSVDLALMGISNRETPHTMTVEYFLYNEEQVLIIPRQHPFAAKYDLPADIQPSVNWEDFHHDDFILSQPGNHFRMMTDHLFHQIKLIPNIYCEINNFFAVRNMVEDGFGIGFLPKSIANGSDSVISIHLDPPNLYRIVVMHHKALALSAPMKHLIQVMQECCKDM